MDFVVGESGKSLQKCYQYVSFPSKTKTTVWIRNFFGITNLSSDFKHNRKINNDFALTNAEVKLPGKPSIEILA